MTLNAEFVAGNDVTLEIQVLDSATGSPVDIDGSTIKWSLFRDKADNAIITKTIGSGITITNGNTGTFEVTLDDAETDELKGRYIHEAVLTLASGDVLTVTQDDISPGRITFRERYTAP